MSIQVGSKWRCEDGRVCTVIEVDDHPDNNGESTMEVLYTDGTTAYPKVRRFEMRHEPLVVIQRTDEIKRITDIGRKGQ